MKRLCITILTVGSLSLGYGQMKVGSGVKKLILGDGASINSGSDIDFEDGIDHISLGNNSSIASDRDIHFGSNIDTLQVGLQSSISADNTISIGDNIGSESVPLSIGVNSFLNAGDNFINNSRIRFGSQGGMIIGGLLTNNAGGELIFNGLGIYEIDSLVNSGLIDFNEQPEIQFTVAKSAHNLTSGRILLSGLESELRILEDLRNENEASINIEQTGASLVVLGDVINNGTGVYGIFNSGLFELGGDFINNGTFDSNNGEIKLSGDFDQIFPIPSSPIAAFTIEKMGGQFELANGSLEIRERLSLKAGVLNVSESGSLVLNGGIIESSSLGLSYIDGKLLWRDIPGNTVPTFPMGKNGFYNPITLFGASQQDIEVSYKNPNTGSPNPGSEVIGVSSFGSWEILRKRDIEEDDFSPLADSLQIQIDFEGEDLQNFFARNNIRNRVNGPSILVADTAENAFDVRIYNPLTSTLLDNSTDSAQFSQIVRDGEGSLITQDKILLQPEGDTTFIALGLAPFIPNGLQPYIPNVFSPNSQTAENKVIKIYGENLVAGPNFKFEIYNRYGAVVYRESSLDIVRNDGWNGEGNNGTEEPQGTYFYQVNDLLYLDKDRNIEIPFNSGNTGQIYLIR